MATIRQTKLDNFAGPIDSLVKELTYLKIKYGDVNILCRLNSFYIQTKE